MSTPKSELTVITPAMAKEWLEKNNTHNRSVTPSDVERYAADMQAGAWRITHQGIGFDVTGRLVDGQHRLLAVVKAAIPVPLMVTRGLPVDAQEVIDAVRPRGVSAQLQLIDGVASAHRTASVCRHLLMLETGVARRKISYREAREVLSRYGPVVKEMINFNNDQPRLSIAPYLAPLVYAVAADPTKIRQFAKKVRDGEHLRRGDPAYALREYLLTGPGRGSDAAREMTSAVVLRSIYAALHDEEITVFRTAVLTQRDSTMMVKIMEFFRLANNTTR